MFLYEPVIEEERFQKTTRGEFLKHLPKFIIAPVEEFSSNISHSCLVLTPTSMNLQILLNAIPPDVIDKSAKEAFERHKQDNNMKGRRLWDPEFADYLGTELLFMQLYSTDLFEAEIELNSFV